MSSSPRNGIYRNGARKSLGQQQETAHRMLDLRSGDQETLPGALTRPAITITHPDDPSDTWQDITTRYHQTSQDLRDATATSSIQFEAQVIPVEGPNRHPTVIRGTHGRFNQPQNSTSETLSVQSQHQRDALPININRKRKDSECSLYVRNSGQQSYFANHASLGSSPNANAVIEPSYVVKSTALTAPILFDDDKVEWDLGNEFEYMSNEEIGRLIRLNPEFDIVDTTDGNEESLKLQRRSLKSAMSGIGRSLSPGVWRSHRSQASHSSNGSQTSQDYASDNEDPYCCEGSHPSNAGFPDGCFFCSKCQLVFCPRCWSKEKTHKRKAVAKDHEKVKPEVARLVLDSLNADWDEETQRENHLGDDRTFWFGAGVDAHGAQPVFREFGRYTKIMVNTYVAESDTRYPALVSFVGETSAGKSSLIKLLIGTQGDGQKTQTPVVGSSRHADIPTSGDVHLYSDPESMHSTRPILYADCEGLNGGNRDPVGAYYKSSRRSSASDEKRPRTSFEQYIRQRHENSERHIRWASDATTSTRSYFVKNFYPRLLYTFSDVIVFVVKNGRAIESVIEQLILWADAVIDAASNQPVLPHAIIVLNATVDEDPNLWDVTNSTEALLQSVIEVIHKNPQFKERAKSWRAMGAQVDSVHSLLLRYYSSIRVVRVPNKDQPAVIHQQVKRLYNEICTMTGCSHATKSDKRMKLSAEELQSYLQAAFDHFCYTLKKPFDFVHTSFANSTIPSDFGGNILKLAIRIKDAWQNRLDGPFLFKHLSYIIASCVMLDTARSKWLGLEERIFDLYDPHFDALLEDFCDRYWPCEFVGSRGRCVNVRAGHSKGHQDDHAIVAAGEYESSFTAASFRDEFLAAIYRNLQGLLQELTHKMRNADIIEMEAAAQIHREVVLRKFYEVLGGAENFVSHSACFSCLMSPPQHQLPCGHILCTPCIRAFGSSRNEYVIELASCPLHGHMAFDTPWTIRIKPETAGLRLLVLDGGGIRGIAELMSLQAIENQLGDELKVQSFFDHIVGTSIGGIIALGLASQDWTVAECIDKLEALAKTAFSRNKTLGFLSSDTLLAARNLTRYKSEPFEEVLREQYGEGNLFGGIQQVPISDQLAPMPKVAVTATTTSGAACVLANYNRPEAFSGSTGMYEFLRSETPEFEIKIWEAARSTSSAPRIFQPYKHTSSGNEFMDGGIRYNNPIDVAMRESKLIWPETETRRPDIVLSLGTAKKIPQVTKRTAFSLSNGSSFLPILSNLNMKLNILKNTQQNVTDPDKTWEKFMEGFRGDRHAQTRFMRLNFELNGPRPKLDEYAKMRAFKEVVEKDLSHRSEEIRFIANRLIATTFFLQLIGQPQTDANGLLVVTGDIRCRFVEETWHAKALGHLLSRRCREAYTMTGDRAHRPCFVIEENTNGRVPEQVLIDMATLNRMQRSGILTLPRITFKVSSPAVEVDIHLRFGGEDLIANHNSIGGFPRRFDTGQARAPILQPSLSFSKKRGSTRQRPRKGWTKPNARGPSTLIQFTKSLYPGLASQLDLTIINQKLTQPSQSFRTLESQAPAAPGSRPSAFELEAEQIGPWHQPSQSVSSTDDVPSARTPIPAWSPVSPEGGYDTYGDSRDTYSATSLFRAELDADPYTESVFELSAHTFSYHSPSESSATTDSRWM